MASTGNQWRQHPGVLVHRAPRARSGGSAAPRHDQEAVAPRARSGDSRRRGRICCNGIERDARTAPPATVRPPARAHPRHLVRLSGRWKQPDQSKGSPSACDKDRIEVDTAINGIEAIEALRRAHTPPVMDCQMRRGMGTRPARLFAQSELEEQLSHHRHDGLGNARRPREVPGGRPMTTTSASRLRASDMAEVRPLRSGQASDRLGYRRRGLSGDDSAMAPATGLGPQASRRTLTEECDPDSDDAHAYSLCQFSDSVDVPG